ncbi:META domain-containing protein [Psychrobacter frigidicola]|uniref:META domain-containing protein n=1 Tax=Psychrobacter frigidicola TaxID=45611 RepID=UPI0019183354|nr:META domain-containing protein [Psychrobacter frigidicola]
MKPTFKISSRPTLKLALLPSLLAVSLALSACQDPSSPTDIEGQDTVDTTSETVNSAATGSADPIDTTTADTSMTVEQQMIENLSRYRWTLATATDNSTQPLTPLMTIKDQITLSFSQYQGQNTVSYSVGCNTMSATYQLQGTTLTIEDSMSTKMSCADLNSAENSLNELMQGDSQLSLVDDETPMLNQLTSNSVTLVWKGKMTAQAKYNTKGETIFWAVNAETNPCSDNSTQQCLQVKPVIYNDQGVKTSEGKWTEFTGNIDGYQHDDKHDEVLRLQRYKLEDNDPIAETTGEEYAYVLDTVIERAVAK